MIKMREYVLSTKKDVAKAAHQQFSSTSTVLMGHVPAQKTAVGQSIHNHCCALFIAIPQSSSD